MINRRLLRVKSVQTLYAYYSDNDKSIKQAEVELFHSIDKTYELYHLMLLLVKDVSDFARMRNEKNRSKHFPSEEELNPNTRLAENRVVKVLEVNEPFNKYLSQVKVSWSNHPELIRDVYKIIIESSVYEEFIATKDNFEEDQKFWIKVFKKLVPNIEIIADTLEEMSIYWNDDLELVLGMVQKTIRGFGPEDISEKAIMPLFKDEDDIDFVKKLFRTAILQGESFKKTIGDVAANWDVERFAFIDIIIMQTAVSELVCFPHIPVKVTLNEYIDIAKIYSTEKSGNFVNGVLDKVADRLTADGTLKKTGRGLME